MPRAKRNRDWAIGQIRVIDSRGTTHTTSGWWGTTDSKHPRASAAAKSIDRIVFPAFNPLRALEAHEIVVYCVPTVATILFLLVGSFFKIQMPKGSLALLLMVLFAFYLLYTAKRSSTRIDAKRSDELHDLAVRHQICLRCGEDLEGLPIADDGCRECPECGAAWKAQH